MASSGQKKYTVKNDKFRRTRGGPSNFLNLFCASCQSWLLLYQKDGSGQLLRLYLDRIHAPDNLSTLHEQYTAADVYKVPTLKCASCGAIIAHPMVYELENRLAYRLIPGRISKQSSNGTIPQVSSTSEEERE